MSMHETFGNRLTAARQRRDLTGAQLAELTALNPTTISHYEIGTRSPGVNNLRKIAAALDVTADYLLGLHNETRRIVS